MSWCDIERRGPGVSPGGFAAGLDARLTLVEGSTDDVRVNLTLTNTGDKPIRLLKWQLPGSEDAPLFLVERDGEKVGYEGALIKRAAPTDKDFQLLKAGQSLTLQAEVSGLYDMSAQGQYSIRYRLPTLPQGAKAAKAKQAQGSESNVVTLWVEGVADDRVLAKAAVAGQLAGACYGLDAIRSDWHQALHQREAITALADQLFELSLGTPTIPEAFAIPEPGAIPEPASTLSAANTP